MSMTSPLPDQVSTTPESMLLPQIVPGVFTHPECDQIENLFQEHHSRHGRIRKDEADAQLRRSEIIWLAATDEHRWIHERIGACVAAVNNRHFQFQLGDPPSRLQLAQYEAAQRGHYTWHTDCGIDRRESMRKLSLSVQLSSPDCYVGGDLILNFGGIPHVMPRERGLIVLFPSFVVHRVAPVFSGTRRSLVAWFRGPAFC